MPRIFYLGPEGTFSHILARRRFGRRADLQACATTEGIFERTLAQPDALGLVPVENSSGGTVHDSVDLLIRHAGRAFIQEELALDVRIALLGHRGAEVRTIYSHYVQIRHHSAWLKARHPGAEVKAVSSTAVAAQEAARCRSSAALASPGAADVYGLEVLEVPRTRGETNVTHFYTIGALEAAGGTALRKTALAVALPNVCGSLHRFLGPFARQKVSLSRIVSRPVPGQPQTYIFFIEIEGAPGSRTVAGALARGRKLAESFANLGSFAVGRKFRS